MIISPELQNFICQLIIIPVLIGWLRWRHLDAALRFFVIYLSIGYFFELINYWDFRPFAMNLINFGFDFPMAFFYFLFLSECMQWENKNRYRCIYALSFIFLIGIDLVFADLNHYRHSTCELIFYFLNLIFSLMLVQRLNATTFNRQQKKILLAILIPNIVFHFLFVKSIAFFYFHYEPQWRYNIGIIHYLPIFLNVISYIIFSIAFLWIPKKEVFLRRIS